RRRCAGRFNRLDGNGRESGHCRAACAASVRNRQTGRRKTIMSLSGSKNRLMAITKELSTRWDETRNYWRDAKSQEFEHRYMVELLANVDRTITVMDKLNELVTKVRNDCE